jgi:hypothetical protein
MCGTKLRLVEEVRYLEIYLDRSLQFISYFCKVREKISKLATTLLRVSKADGGLKKKSLRVIYPALCASVAIYGTPVWYHKVTTVDNKRKIDAAQRGFLPLLTNAWPTLPVLAGVLPLDREVIRTAGNWYVKRGLESRFEDLRVERIPPDCPDDIRLHLTSTKRKALKRRYMNTWQNRWIPMDI